MSPKVHVHSTIGFLSTWSVYEGTSIDDYTHALLQGVCVAAHESDCILLTGCGISLPGSPLASRTAWAAPGTDMDFIPVGPWNADGLIIIPDDLSDLQFEYVQDLIRSDYPIVLTTAEKPGPLVAIDNAGGIRQAFDHLLQHGHRQIAFIIMPLLSVTLTGTIIVRQLITHALQKNGKLLRSFFSLGFTKVY